MGTNTAIIMVDRTARFPRVTILDQRHDRHPRNWAARIFIVVVVAAWGCIAVTHTAAFRIRSSNSEMAHRLAPYDGRMTALAAAFLADPAAPEADRGRADRTARLALRQDATAVAAVSTLGLDAQILSRDAEAGKLFAYAQRLSRRDMQSQLWAIEDSVRRNDVAGALYHYDAALRAAPNLSAMLFPVLSSATSDPEIRRGLVTTLKSATIWRDSFINYVSANSTDPRSTALLLTELTAAKIPVARAPQASVVRLLMQSGFHDDAWDFYAKGALYANRWASRDPRFMLGDTAPTLFDWNVVAPPGISASIQDGKPGGLFDFSASAMTSGVVLQQVQLLPPGAYRLVGHSVDIRQSGGARPYWQLTCQDGKELGRVPVPNSTASSGRFDGLLTVPAGCPVQTLSFVVQAPEAVAEASGQIDFVLLKPAR